MYRTFKSASGIEMLLDMDMFAGLLSMQAAMAAGTTYHVAIAGNDSNSGSSGRRSGRSTSALKSWRREIRATFSRVQTGKR